MSVMIIRRGNVPILQYPLNGHDITIGRDETSDIHLLGESVSRQHGVLSPEGASYRYTNVGRNGTGISGKKISDHVLRIGDILEIADWELQYLQEDCELCTETIIPTVTLATRRASRAKHRLIGTSPAMRRLRSQIPLIAQSNAAACLLGETGSGKEVVANVIHDASPRSTGPFVAVNCGAIPASMIESELFGYDKGAFTGALRDHRGFIEQASGGTLFLDEIGELPLELQTRLLRVLETGAFRRIGGPHELHADFRLISATHRNLQQAIADGQFREDLFFRLYVLPLELPPLRNHCDDIPSLVAHFSQEFGRPNVTWDQDAIDRLIAHPWPGNVRELRNTIQRTLIMTDATTITTSDIKLLTASPSTARPDANLNDQERVIIMRALEKHGGNNTRTAAELGIARSTLLTKLKKYTID